MIARYNRFYGVTDTYVLRMPVKRFFVLYRQIRRLQAEEALMQLRIVSHPYQDPKKNRGDTFVQDLYEAAGLKYNEPAQDLVTAQDFAEWGIGVKYANPTDDLSKAITVKGGASNGSSGNS
jgi:hypothetical protein